MVKEGKTVFYDGMRVNKEHLSHMEYILLDAIKDIRTALGLGKICWGLKATVKNSSNIEISEGLAFDKKGRRIYVKQPLTIKMSLSKESSLKYVVIKHKLEEKKLEGDVVDTILGDSFEILSVDSFPTEDPDSILIALIKKKENGIVIDQRTAPFITATDHSHSGKLVETNGRFVFDGKKIAIHQPLFPKPHFDSGFIRIENGESKKIVHNSQSYELLVHIIKKSDEIKYVNNRMGYWYELSDPDTIVVHNDIDESVESNVQFRILIWKFETEVTKVRVPRLLGMTWKDANKLLLDIGLAVGELSAKKVGKEEAGKIVKQGPAEGTFVIPNATVDLVIGELSKEKVPDVRNLTKYKAEKTLEESGWKYRFTPVKVSEHDAKIGRISGQDPAPGTTVKRAAVEIELSIVLYNFEVETIEGIGEVYGKRFRELSPSIDTLGKLSLVDGKVQIKGVSGERLLIWKYMANLMTIIPGLDGNGAEILVKGRNVKTPDELALVGQEFESFYSECIESAEKIKIPGDYLNNYFTQQNVKKWVNAAKEIANP